MSQKIIYPEKTKVLEALAKKNNMSIKELMLKFAKLSILNKDTVLKSIKKDNKTDSYYLEIIRPKSYKYNQITYNIIDFSISADDFSFFVYSKGYKSKINPYSVAVETNRDLSVEWSKLLREFNKPAIKKEIESVSEYNKQIESMKYLINSNPIPSIDNTTLSQENLLLYYDNKEHQTFKDKAFEQTLGKGKYAKIVKICKKIKSNYKEVIDDIMDKNC